jgi:hypothetical protein
MSASRRDLLTIGAAAGMGAFAKQAGAATFGNADEPARGVVKKDEITATSNFGDFQNGFTPKRCKALLRAILLTLRPLSAKRPRPCRNGYTGMCRRPPGTDGPNAPMWTRFPATASCPG